MEKFSRKKNFIHKFSRNVFAVLLLLVTGITGCKSVEPETPIEPLSEDRRLVVYTSHKEEIYAPIISEFETRTGIWVSVETYGTTELLELIKASDGNFICDVSFGGGVESYGAYTDCFIPYENPQIDKIKRKDREANNLWTAFSELPVVIIYNSKLVSSKQAPSGWDALFEEKWKGEIAFADPLTSGSSFTILSTILQVTGEDEAETIDDFVSQLDGKILSSSSDVVEMVAQGKCQIGLTLEETALKAIGEGKDISIVYPVEGTSSVPDAAAIVKGAIHEENAKLFMDFIAGEDVQTLITTEKYRRSVRKDVENSVEASDLRLMNYNIPLAVERRPYVLDTWAMLTGKPVNHE